MARLTLWNKSVIGYEIIVDEPVLQGCLEHLAASGFFDEVALTLDDGTRFSLDGADLLKAALKVRGHTS